MYFTSTFPILKNYTYLRRNKKVTQTTSENKNYLSLVFEPRHFDSLSFGTLNQSLLYLQSLGMNFIETTTQRICRRARNIFHSTGLIPHWVYLRPQQSTIINLPVEAKLIDKLHAAGILNSVRGKGIRISFYFYNTQQDLDRLIEVLDR